MNLTKEILILAVRGYRIALSPLKTLLFGPMSGCRFTPTCSEYAIEALRRKGVLLGSWLTFKRICRCHPWGGCGYDPVPEAVHRLTPLFSHQAKPATNLTLSRIQREST